MNFEQVKEILRTSAQIEIKSLLAAGVKDKELFQVVMKAIHDDFGCHCNFEREMGEKTEREEGDQTSNKKQKF